MTREQKLEAALRDMVHAVCGPTGLHEAVKIDTGMSYPWPALDLAEDAAMLALATPPDPSWEDREDEFTVAIDKAHPHHTKDYPTYTKALELVSNRHSKGALVGLVNYLLSQVPDAETRVVSVEDVLTAAVDEYLLQHVMETDWHRSGRHAAVRGLMVRLGLYPLLDQAIEELLSRAIIEGKDHE